MRRKRRSRETAFSLVATCGRKPARLAPWRSWTQPSFQGCCDLYFTYDGVGNRVTSAVGAATDTYTYPPASNRLSGITLAAGGTRAYTYDAAGNVITDSRGAGYAYTYDAAGRMASMSINGVLQGTYNYDFAGRQAIRTTVIPPFLIGSGRHAESWL